VNHFWRLDCIDFPPISTQYNMAIPGLEDYLAQHPDAGVYTRVRLAGLAAGGGERVAALVVSLDDAQEVLYDRFGVDALRGGQMEDFSAKLADLADHFRLIGLDLHFVYCRAGLGGRSWYAWATEEKDREDKYRSNVFHALERGQEPDRQQWRSWCLAGDVRVEEIVKRATGCEITSVDVNGDEQLVRKAIEVGAVGILGQNTSYAIFDLPEGLDYYTLKDLSVKDMSTTKVNRPAVANYLGVDPAHLPLLAMLKGPNDMVDVEGVNTFHRLLLDQPDGDLEHWRVFQHLAGVVAAFPTTREGILCAMNTFWRKHPTLSEELPLEKAKQALNGYFLYEEDHNEQKGPSSSSTQAMDKLLPMLKMGDRHHEGTRHRCLLFDYNLMSCPPDLFEGVRARLYGLLLLHHPDVLGESGFRPEVVVQDLVYRGKGASAKRVAPAMPPMAFREVFECVPDEEMNAVAVRKAMLAYVLTGEVDFDMDGLEERHFSLTVTLRAMQSNKDQGPWLNEAELLAFIMQHLLLESLSPDEVKSACRLNPAHLPSARTVSLATAFAASPFAVAWSAAGRPVTYNPGREFDAGLFCRMIRDELTMETALTMAERMDSLAANKVRKILNVATRKGAFIRY